eukprot:15351494-Ditylum_brightwellii.AAC.1
MKLSTFEHTRWMYCCNKLYNNKKDYTEQPEELQAHIKLIYAHKDDLLTTDRYVFDTELEYWENASITQMKCWLKVHRPLICYCLKIAATQKKKQAGDIRKYITGAASTVIPQEKTNKKSKHKKTKKKVSIAKNNTSDQDIRKFLHKTTFKTAMCTKYTQMPYIHDYN